MAASATINTITKLQNVFLITGSIALSGNYVLHGDTVDLSTSGKLPVSTPTVPVYAQVTENPNPGSSASGYQFVLDLGTNLATNKLQVFQSPGSANPLAELAAGAYPAGLTSAKLNFFAIIPSL